MAPINRPEPVRVSPPRLRPSRASRLAAGAVKVIGLFSAAVSATHPLTAGLAALAGQPGCVPTIESCEKPINLGTLSVDPEKIKVKSEDLKSGAYNTWKAGPVGCENKTKPKLIIHFPEGLLDSTGKPIDKTYDADPVTGIFVITEKFYAETKKPIPGDLQYYNPNMQSFKTIGGAVTLGRFYTDATNAPCDSNPNPTLTGYLLNDTDLTKTKIYVGDTVKFFYPKASIGFCDGTTAATASGKIDISWSVDGDKYNPLVSEDETNYTFNVLFTTVGTKKVGFRVELKDKTDPKVTHQDVWRDGIYVNPIDAAGVDLSLSLSDSVARVGLPFTATLRKPDLAKWNYQIDFGEGPPVPTDSVGSAQHTYKTVGSASISVMAINKADPSIKITDLYAAVKISIVPAATIVPDLTFIMSDSFARVGTPFTVTLNKLDAKWTYAVDFGVDSSSIVSVDPTTRAAAYSYLSPGKAGISVIATNKADPSIKASDPYPVTISIVSALAPVPNLSISPAAYGPAPWTITADASGSYAVAPGASIAKCSFNWDGKIIEESTSCKMSHTYSSAGTFTLRATAFDSLGNTAYTDTVIKPY